MTDALASWRLEDLAQRCAEETQKFRQQRLSDKPVSHNTQFCYEIFRRALADRAVEAWDHIVGLYQRQVQAWILRVPASTPYLDELDAIVNCAFIKFWRACRSKDLAAFPSLE